MSYVTPIEMIDVQNLSKTYGEKTVLRSITTSFEREKTHVLLGSSGCGKSTLLRLILGLIEPDTGQVKVDGTPVNSTTRQKLSQKTGYVIQDGGLFPNMTAEENITLVARLRKWSPKETKTRLEELCSLVSIDPSLPKRYPKELSGGQRQRIGLMRALFMNPKVLLLDEPLGALDPIIRAELQSELKRIFNQLKKTVLLVTHDIGEAAYFGHTISLMKGGEILQKSTFKEMLQAPSDPFVTRFINAQRPPPELPGLRPELGKEAIA